MQILLFIGKSIAAEDDASGGCTNQYKVSIVQNNLHVDYSNSSLTDACFQRFIETFENVSMIVDLNLDLNRLTTFVDITRNNDRILFPSLLYLTMKKNSLQEVPPLLSKFAPKLLSLDLTYNLITNVSASNFVNESNVHVGYPSLFNLILSYNRINKLLGDPFKFGFDQLKRMYLDHNRINSIDASTFQGLSSLILLDLQSNMIESISAKTLEFSKVLSFLYLGGNRLREIWSYTFVNLQQMNVLSLANNNISKIFNHAISKTYIRKLDLSHNKLAMILKLSLIHI